MISFRTKRNEMNVGKYSFSKEDIVLFVITLAINFFLSIALQIFLMNSLQVTSSICILASVLMFFVYKIREHQFWLKSYVVTVFAFFLSSLGAFASSVYLQSLVLIVILALSYKYCRHQYWLVLPMVFFLMSFGVTWVLFKVGQYAEGSNNYVAHLNDMWVNLDGVARFELLVPVISVFIALFVLKLRYSNNPKVL